MSGHEILIVEDDANLGILLKRQLEASGHPVVLAGSEEDAERQLGGGLRPSMILLDVNLPGESGWTLLRHQAFADAGSPPVVVMSATPVSPRRLREFGVAGYLPKPFSVEVLVSCVARLGAAPNVSATLKEVDA